VLGWGGWGWGGASNAGTVMEMASNARVPHFAPCHQIGRPLPPPPSKGAGDDAGNVGVMMEMISNLVAADAPLKAPVLFLFSGAEEPLCQVSGRAEGAAMAACGGAAASCALPVAARGAPAAGPTPLTSIPRVPRPRPPPPPPPRRPPPPPPTPPPPPPTHRPALDPQSASAFMHHSKWARRVGAFINLESLGPGGVPIVFQHSSAWAVHAYAAGAAHPRGAIVAQVGRRRPARRRPRRRFP
jgi:hypothetical protein